MKKTQGIFYIFLLLFVCLQLNNNAFDMPDNDSVEMEQVDDSNEDFDTEFFEIIKLTNYPFCTENSIKNPISIKSQKVHPIIFDSDYNPPEA